MVQAQNILVSLAFFDFFIFFGAFFSACLHSDPLCPSLGRGRISSGEEGCISSFEVDVDGLGESVSVFGGSLLFLEAAAATGWVDLSVT